MITRLLPTPVVALDGVGSKGYTSRRVPVTGDLSHPRWQTTTSPSVRHPRLPADSQRDDDVAPDT
ncbi:MAG: hypothetical protein M3220_15475 [Chloroflexota bacterium]|nr:hypothetical protein [Chloroflexota bacterium]